MRIDADSHAYPKEVMEIATRLGCLKHGIDKHGRDFVYAPSGSINAWGKKYYDPEARYPAMKDAGFDKQVLLCEQGYVPDYVDLETSKPLARAYNDWVSNMQKQNEKFIGCAEIPHQDPEAAIVEAIRAIDDLGLKAIRIDGTWSGKNIESKEWWRFFEVINERKVPLFLHSHGGDPAAPNPNIIGANRLGAIGVVRGSDGEEKSLWPVPTLVGFTLEAMCLVAGLVLQGVLKQFANLRIVILESGVGWVPFFASRLDLLDLTAKAQLQGVWGEVFGRQRPISSAPSEYVKKHFWFGLDDVGEVQTTSLVRELGLGKRLLASTDFPHPEGSLDIIRWVNQLGISESDKEAICGKNLTELLGLN